jgi:hypothetical protein
MHPQSLQHRHEKILIENAKQHRQREKVEVHLEVEAVEAYIGSQICIGHKTVQDNAVM